MAGQKMALVTVTAPGSYYSCVAAVDTKENINALSGTHFHLRAFTIWPSIIAAMIWSFS